MISVVLAASSGWVTISQSRHGAQVNTIKKQMAGEALDYGPMIQQTLGYLWHLPADSTSTEGLGGGITWAWDPELCANFQPQFREDFFFIEYISCKDLKAAMHRAFMSWSANHAYISFVDVTTECEKLDRQRGGEGKAWAQCPLVEIWVTGLAPPPPPPVSAESASPPPPPPSPTSPPPPARRHLEASHPRREGEDYDLECADEDCEINVDVGGAFYQETADQAAATALPMAKVAYSFRYTSGQDAGVLDAQGRANPKPTIETYGATLSFNTQLCWCALAADAARRPPARAARAPPALLADARPPHPPRARYLDSTFCARFHALKEHVDEPGMIEVYGRIGIFCLFAAIVAFEGCQLLSLARKVCGNWNGAIRRNFGAILLTPASRSEGVLPRRDGA